MNSILTSLKQLLCDRKLTSPNAQIIINELKTIASSLKQQPQDNGTLISILNRLSILQAQLTCETKQKSSDLILAVQYAQNLINYINDPFVIDPYYNTLKLKLPTASTPRNVYITAIIQLLNNL
jgi:hypothetical protein